MDNPAFQNDQAQGAARPPKKPLTRANSTLTPTNKSWHLTQMPRSKLSRYNSVVLPKNCCSEETPNYLDGPASLDYPFFSKTSPTNNLISDNSLWTKEFWSDQYNKLHSSSPSFEKFPLSQSGVSTIYDPQFLSSKLGYSSSHISGNQDMKKEKWAGLGGWRCHFSSHRPNLSSSQKLAAMLCALVLTLLASGNIIYILKTVKRPIESPNKTAWVDIMLVSGEFRITNEPYRDILANQSSAEFQNLSALITHQLDSLFSLSVMSEVYHSTVVTALVPGLTVRCQLVMRAGHRLTASQVGLTFLGGLRNQHGHVWLGNYSIDIQSIGFQANSDAVSWSDWSEWGTCTHTHEFGFVQVRTRNCSLRSGQNLFTTLPCLLVPQHLGNLETAPCRPEEDFVMTAESNFLLSKVPSSVHSKRSERIVGELKISRKDCNNNSHVHHSNNKIEITADISEQPIKNVSSACMCDAGKVCITLHDQVSPACLPVLDPTDPTGCGGHCKLNTQLCHKIHDNTFRCIDDSKCLEDEWQCENRLCIPLSKRCDGHFNCYDHTDEQNCDCVGTDQFTCNDSQCVPNHRFCDGFPDCKDHSDEPFGCGGECKSHEFKCRNSRCVAQSKRCDGADDCGDQSDETDCPVAAPA